MAIEIIPQKQKAAAEILDKSRRQTQGESYLQEQIAAFNRKQSMNIRKSRCGSLMEEQLRKTM